MASFRPRVWKFAISTPSPAPAQHATARRCSRFGKISAPAAKLLSCTGPRLAAPNRRCNSHSIFAGTKEAEMKTKNRQQLLTIAALAVVALFAADKLLLGPLTQFWQD